MVFEYNCVILGAEKMSVAAGMVDSFVAKRRLCVLDRVPLCGPLFPRVRHLDPVCVCRLHQGSGPGCVR